MVPVVVCERTRVEEAAPSKTVVNFILKNRYGVDLRLMKRRIRRGNTTVKTEYGRSRFTRRK